MKPTSRLLCVLVAGLATTSCARDSNPAAPTTLNAFSIGSTATGVLVGAGDIGDCGAGAEATARLLDRISGTVFTAGDNAYMNGTLEQYRRCYEPSWGRHRARTRPTPGNHEYESGGAASYFEFFGGNAGPTGLGYYSYTVGPWTILSLNSEIPSGPGSAQSTWVRAELSSKRALCTAVVWHRPLFSSGRHGDNPDMRDLWRTLDEFDVDLVINAHDHIYERFAPQDPEGRFDPRRGMREFVVGTGGAGLTEFRNVRANSEVRAPALGVTAFTLMGGTYQWEFVPVEGESFRDSGSASCH